MFRVAPGNLDLEAVCGTTACGVASYSNGSQLLYYGERNYVNGVFTGIKWQSDEFARRWLLLRKGVLLANTFVPADLARSASAVAASSGAAVPVTSIANGATTSAPAVDSILVWPASEQFERGHVAVVVEVGDAFVRVADQNRKYAPWGEGVHFSFELPLKRDAASSNVSVVDPSGASPAAWLVVDALNRSDSKAPLSDVHPSLIAHPADDVMLLKRVTFIPTSAPGAWLDESNPAEKQFVKTFGMDLSRTRLDEAEANYYESNRTLMDACHAAGINLHRMFLAATERVIGSDDLMERFGIPKELWPRIRHSWATQPYAISGRFDYALSDDGKVMKTFEYNADSASTLLECSVIQEKWARSVGVTEGSISSGSNIDKLLVHAWREVVAGGAVAAGSTVHLCVDNDDEEQYTALYVGSGAERAGLKSQLHVMFDDFEWRDNHVFDKKSGERVKTVWKTWAWETAITDLNNAVESGARGPGFAPKDGDAVRLCDILLGDQDITIFEPMWKLIPSNKAILPVLWELFPGHQNLLRTEWELTPELKSSGYAKKPIVGRTGQNVTVVDGDGSPLGKSEGKFSERDHVYQELFKLPKRDDYHAIMGGWIIGSLYGGTGIREDKSIITNVESPFSAIRIKLDSK